jgi:DNA mismatch repair ATPase MutS
MGIPTDHMSNLEVASTLTYFHLYHVLRRTEEEHRAKLVYNFLSNPLFGYFNIDTSEDILSEQIVEFLYRIEDLRSYLKPKIRGYDPNPKKCKCKD